MDDRKGGGIGGRKGQMLPFIRKPAQIQGLSVNFVSQIVVPWAANEHRDQATDVNKIHTAGWKNTILFLSRIYEWARFVEVFILSRRQPRSLQFAQDSRGHDRAEKEYVWICEREDASVGF